jgi:hypothetical protein
MAAPKECHYLGPVHERCETMMHPKRLKQLATYPDRFGAWLRLGALGLATLAVNGAALIFAFFVRVPGHEDYTRGIGALLQCAGVMFVIFGVLMTRAQFGLPSLHGAIIAWFCGVPPIFPKDHFLHMDGVLAGATAFGVGSVRTGLKPDASTDEKIDFLLKEIERHDCALEAASALAKKRHDSLKAQIDAETAKRDTDIRDLRQLLKSHATGGLDLSFCGAVFLFVGVALGTLPYSWLA